MAGQAAFKGPEDGQGRQSPARHAEERCLLLQEVSADRETALNGTITLLPHPGIM